MAASVDTPAKAALVVPSEPMADAIAAEWEAQTDKIEPLTMPFTRSANAAVDKVAVQFEDVATMISDYGDSDLICYRAESPAELVKRQTQAWDPLVEWSATGLGAPLSVRSGVMHQPQDISSLKALGEKVHSFGVFELTALHDLVALSGSLIIGLAVTERFREATELWDLSRIDENWQVEQWGEDEQAAADAEKKCLAFMHAVQFFNLARG